MAADGGRLQVLADRLFSGEESGQSPPQRWMPRYLAVAALLALIIVARRPDIVTNPQFWAEDGYIFFSENLILGFPTALAKMYRNFPYLAHRLIAFAGGLVPLADAPRVYTTSAIAITALGLAIFALPAFRHLVRSQALRVLFGVAIVCAPSDTEVLGTVTNLGWFLAIVLTLISLVRLPRAPWRVALLAVAGALLVASTPLAVIDLPLWLLRAWRGARRSDRREVGFSLALVAALASMSLITRGLGAQLPLLPGERWLRDPAGFVQADLGALAYATASLSVPPDVLARVAAAGMLAVGGLAGLVLAALLALCARGRLRSLPTLLVAIVLFAAYVFILFVGRGKVYLLFGGPAWVRVPDRYMIFPTAMFVLAVIAVLDGLAPGRTRRLISAAVAALLIGSWSSRFMVAPLRDVNWARAAAQLERKLATHSRAPLQLASNPAWAPIGFDVLRMMPPGRQHADTVIGRLGAQGSFSQQFISGCNRLGGVELRLGAASPSTQGALRMALTDEDGTIVVQQETPRTELPLDGSWHGLYFEPVAGSLGKRYTLILQAIDNDAGGSINVLGRRGDTSANGVAALSDRIAQGDATFRYGCAPLR
jgi:hypothetical protein